MASNRASDWAVSKTSRVALVFAVSLCLSVTTAFSPTVSVFGRHRLAVGDSSFLRSVAALPRSARNHVQGLNKLRMAMMDNRPDQSGDEEGKSQGGELGADQNLTHSEMFVPGAVSATQLQYMACQTQLKHAVDEEDFETAASIKDTMKALEQAELKAMYRKILDKSSALREANERAKTRNSLEDDLQRAVLEEDFEEAMRLKESIDAAKARAKTGAARLPLLRRIDMVWIESEIGSRIVQARAREEERMKDPITRLESELKHALEDEFFEDAAQIRDQLQAEEQERDVKKMHRDMKRQLAFKTAELERLKRNPVLHLNHQFQAAVDAEEYELAASVLFELRQAEADRMFHALRKSVKAAEERNRRSSPANQLETELDQSIAEEDFEKACELRDKLNARDKFSGLQAALQDAESTGRFEEAQMIKEHLVDMYARDLSTPMLMAMGFQYTPPAFRIGQPIYHKTLGFRGVVLGWHDSCRASESWMQHHEIDKLSNGRNQRFYHILPDTRDVSLSKTEDGLWIGDCDPAFLCGRDASDRLPFMQTGYVAEQYLAPLGFEQCTGVFASVLKPLKSIISGSTPVQHPLVPFYFMSFRAGRYRSDRRLRDIMFYHIPEWLDEDEPR